MTDRKTVLVHIHVSQGDTATKAGAGSVKAVVSSPHGTHTTHTTHSAVTAGAASARSERSWAVAFHGQRYEVVDAGANGMTITRDGTAVWTGQRLPTGAYHTRTSTLTAPKLEGLLKLVAVGDDRTPKVHVAAPRHSSAVKRVKAHARSTESKRPISAAQAEALARGRDVRTEQLVSQRAGAAPAPSAKPKAKRGRSANPSRTAESAARPMSKPVPKPKPASKASGARSTARPSSSGSSSGGAAAPAKRKPGRPRKHAAAVAVAPTPSKRTERAPATRRSVRNPGVDDTAVLAEVKKKLKRDDPDNAASNYDVLRRVWFAGGREATLAWMAARNITTVVEAFRDWVDKNPEAARVLLEQGSSNSRTRAA